MAHNTDTPHTSSVTDHPPGTVGNPLHAVEAGHPDSDAVVLLHGWPQDWTAWGQVMTLAAATHHVVAVDLPGLHGSAPVADGTKTAMADALHETVTALGLGRHVVVGHDIGAMTAYAYLRRYTDGPRAAVLMNAAVPGVEPWSKVLANPYIWHFAFHAVPDLPEALVSGRQRPYLDYFFDAIAHRPDAIDPTSRDHYAATYTPAAALAAGFSWYRAFSTDAETNRTTTDPVRTPLLYLRGEFEGGDLDEYTAGLHAVGCTSVTAARIPDSGHFTPEENPSGVWAAIRRFLDDIPAA